MSILAAHPGRTAGQPLAAEILELVLVSQGYRFAVAGGRAHAGRRAQRRGLRGFCLRPGRGARWERLSPSRTRAASDAEWWQTPALIKRQVLPPCMCAHAAVPGCHRGPELGKMRRGPGHGCRGGAVSHWEMLNHRVEGLKPVRAKPAGARGHWGGTSPPLRRQPGQGWSRRQPGPTFSGQARPWPSRVDAGGRGAMLGSGTTRRGAGRQGRAAAPFAGGRITPG